MLQDVVRYQEIGASGVAVFRFAEALDLIRRGLTKQLLEFRGAPLVDKADLVDCAAVSR
jgi:hypothetical protein